MKENRLKDTILWVLINFQINIVQQIDVDGWLLFTIWPIVVIDLALCWRWGHQGQSLIGNMLTPIYRKIVSHPTDKLTSVWIIHIG